MDILNLKHIALAYWLGCPMNDITVIDEERYDRGKESYRVLTDFEAEEAWEESLDSYIDECLEIPKHLRFYFDEDKWKSDAKTDGRGHSLSSYDGEENSVEVEIDGTEYEFYIYREN